MKPRFVVILVVAVLIAIFAGSGVLAGLALRPKPVAQEEQGPARTSIMLSNSRSGIKACLHDRVLAMLELGERDADKLTEWSVRHCGGNLAFFLESDLEMPKARVASYVERVARDQVRELMGGR